MTGWQALSVFTLGVSATIAAGALGAAAGVWFNDDAFAFAAGLTGLVKIDTGGRLFLSVGLGVVGCLVAYYLLEFQQWIANQVDRRAMRALQRRFEAIEDTNGTEAAAIWLANQLPRVLADSKVELFGGPTEGTIALAKYLGRRARIGLSVDK